ncbi:MAG: hypothetical protein OMM_14646, partial [Candidatus Magnetoglobus multicellularis str. Araruama]
MADYNNHRIQVFTSSGNYSYSIGSGNSGGGIGEFDGPIGVYVDSSGLIYVADNSNDRIQVFTASGAYNYSLGQLNYPQDLRIYNNKIYVTDNHRLMIYNMSSQTTHTVVTGNVGIGTTTPTEKLEVDGNIKITNDLILANATNSVSQTILKAMTPSEARTITLPDASGLVVVSDDGNITFPDGSITAPKLANNPGNGITGQTLISKGDGTFEWGGFVASQTTQYDGSGASLEYTIGGDSSGNGTRELSNPSDVDIDSNGNI